MRLLLLGPPGAGKGTQARRIAEEHGVPHIASGDLLRDAIRRQTPLGTEAKRWMDEGDLVPDDVVVQIVAERLEAPDAEGFVLDGFPRTREQAAALDRMLDGAERSLDAVIHLEVPDEKIIERLSGRRMCPTCQRAYHMVYDPPAEDERCDEDGTGLVRRRDDEPETVRHRLEVQYHAPIRGLLAYYAEQGRLCTVDGLGSVEEVATRLDEAIEKARSGGNPQGELRDRGGEAGRTSSGAREASG